MITTQPTIINLHKLHKRYIKILIEQNTSNEKQNISTSSTYWYKKSTVKDLKVVIFGRGFSHDSAKFIYTCTVTIFEQLKVL